MAVAPFQPHTTGLTPGSAVTRSRNAAPRISKLRYWSNEAQAGDSSTTGSASPEASASRAALATATSSVSRNLVRHPLAERAGKFLRRLADQIGFSDARKKFGETGDAAEFRFAAGDPEDVGKGRQRMRRGVGIGALGIVDEQHVAAAADLLHAVGEAGKTAQAVLQHLGGDAERQRAGGGAGGILRIVQAAQRADAADPRDLAAGAAGGAQDHFALDIDAVGQRIFHGDADHALAGLFDAVGGVAAPAVVDADDRGALLLHAGDQALLDGGIMFERAVAVDMVFADIEQDADAWDRGSGARSIWYDDISMTWTRPMRGGSSDRIAVPILPPIWVS